MSQVVEISLEDIIVGPNRSGEVHPNETIKMIANSIELEGGIIKPLIVRVVGKKYELVCGLKRLKAAMMNGLSTVPCEVRNLNDKEAAQLAFDDNMYPG